MITYRATLTDELAHCLSRLLTEERRRRGTPVADGLRLETAEGIKIVKKGSRSRRVRNVG
ncbi:hypothetical protein ACWEV3_16255 [Saccharopolyspora sp. NPDC003752]